MRFQLYTLRFSMVARGRVRFPAGLAANVLRGALGTVLRDLACDPECPGARNCEATASCGYARLFEPGRQPGIEAGPSGLADSPRPFVLRCAHLDETTFSPGAPFQFQVNLFDLRPESVELMIAAFAEIGRRGFGAGRGTAELLDVEGSDGLLTLPLGPVAEAGKRIRVRFLTPMELKAGGAIVERPEFAVLASRVRDRIATLCGLYGEGPLAMDFAGFGKRAGTVRMLRCESRHVDRERRSSRTGQSHSLGGLVGEAEYEGDLREFLPFLNAAEWTGVGRQTTWGKGAIQVEEIPLAR